MFFKKLDFLSNSPSFYFYHKKTNKTIFGGILFIIYIIIMIIITIFYLLDYSLNDKYDIRYSLYKDFTKKAEENNKIDELNLNLNFSIDIFKMNDTLKRLNVSDRFFIVVDPYSPNRNILANGDKFTGNPENIFLLIGYNCTFNCSLEENEDKNDNIIAYVLRLNYSGYKINHQSKDIPLETNNDKYIFYKEFYFFFTKTTYININWQKIYYKEERRPLDLIYGLSYEKKEYTAIDIDSFVYFSNDIPIDYNFDEVNTFTKRVLVIIQMKNENNQYIEYIRTKNNILEVFADIGALYSSIFSIFAFIFSFYSENYDNYTIIKNVLSTSKLVKKITKNNKININNSIKLENLSLNNKRFTTNKNFIYRDSNKSMDVSIKRTLGKKNEEEEKVWNLGKINFIYFILENINCIKKKKKKEYNIIDICNQIISKYTSIDLILHNQIIFEKLMKDYQLEGKDLDIIGNSILLKQLSLVT